MFKWHHKHSIELDIPITHFCDFGLNPANWPKWIDQLESCHVEKISHGESSIKAKIKNKNAYTSILLTEVEPYKNYKTSIKVPFFTQGTTLFLHEISSRKTKIILEASVTSFLTPFFKSYFRKNIELQYLKFFQVLLDTAPNSQ